MERIFNGSKIYAKGFYANGKDRYELRLIKDGTDPERYEKELEALLVELVLKSREIRQLEAAKAEPGLR